MKSVVSYPDRGPFGDFTYRGNTSGYLIKDLIETFGAKLVLDPMEGSGTTRDVCSFLHIPYIGYDLHKGDDLLDWRTQKKIRADIEEAGQEPDFIFWHPPYWSMITYSDDNRDFSRGPYSMWLNRMSSGLNFLSSIMHRDGMIVVLLGDLVRGGKTYMLNDDALSLGILTRARLRPEFRIIKVQHNTKSNGQVGYPITLDHEYVTILRRAAFQWPETWRQTSVSV